MKSIVVELSEFLVTVRDGDDVVRQITDCGFGRQEGAGNTTPVLTDGKLSSWKRKADYCSSTYGRGRSTRTTSYHLATSSHLLCLRVGTQSSHLTVAASRLRIADAHAETILDSIVQGPQPVRYLEESAAAAGRRGDEDTGLKQRELRRLSSAEVRSSAVGAKGRPNRPQGLNLSGRSG
jgi:hypothetical protein